MELPPLLAGTKIEKETGFKSVTLRWSNERGKLGRYLIAGFLLVWLLVWSAGLLTAGASFFTGNEGPPLFMAVWLVLWLVGGSFVGFAFYQLVRPSQPSVVTLTEDAFTYETGRVAVNPFDYVHWRWRGRTQLDFWRKLRQQPQTYHYPRANCAPFVLDGTGDLQRLRFDVGAERVVIGETLSEPEREWLHAALEAWRTAS